jgi:hypothetical protein
MKVESTSTHTKFAAQLILQLSNMKKIIGKYSEAL